MLGHIKGSVRDFLFQFRDENRTEMVQYGGEISSEASSTITKDSLLLRFIPMVRFFTPYRQYASVPHLFELQVRSVSNWNDAVSNKTVDRVPEPAIGSDLTISSSLVGNLTEKTASFSQSIETTPSPTLVEDRFQSSLLSQKLEKEGLWLTPCCRPR